MTVFKKIAALQIPPSTLQPLWRYLSFERLKDLLTSEELYFVHLPRLSDGLEGTITERTRQRLYEWALNQYGDVAAASAEVARHEKHSAAFFVNSWHMNHHESYLMWRTYAERGFAIQTNFELAAYAFETSPEQVQGGVVRYVDFSREALPLGNVYTPVSTKDLPYSDEREFRFFHWQPKYGDEFADFYGNVPPAGIRIRVDLNALIQSIHISPKTQDPTQLEEIECLVSCRRLTCSLRRSNVHIAT